ncbi:phage tail assembly protein [Acinetobacter defluvii]|uniref:phage tail assembly protein n=1 Tax=Acinetobacter defluvii TaxID=1871111 RepID=UPI00148F53B9|nr:phage tail assembly protein [Acinetobacter defluvii]
MTDKTTNTPVESTTTKTAQVQNTQAIQDPNVRIVELENPIIRGDQRFTTIQLRKPNVGTLRNLSLQDVLKWDVNATNTLLTRVTLPTLNLNEINEMDVSDYTSLAVELTNFLVSAKAKSQAALMT